jgi:hypothetical protein
MLSQLNAPAQARKGAAPDSTAIAQGCLLMSSGQDSECSGLETELAFGAATFRRRLYRYISAPPLPPHRNYANICDLICYCSDMEGSTWLEVGGRVDGYKNGQMFLQRRTIDLLS